MYKALGPKLQESAYIRQQSDMSKPPQDAISRWYACLPNSRENCAISHS